MNTVVAKTRLTDAKRALWRCQNRSAADIAGRALHALQRRSWPEDRPWDVSPREWAQELVGQLSLALKEN